MTRATIELEEVGDGDPIDPIACYECSQTRFSACSYLDGECPLDLFGPD